MASAYPQRSSYRRGLDPRRRAGALGLSLLVVGLLILALLRLGGVTLTRPTEGRSLTTFDLNADDQQRAPQQRQATRRAATKAAPAAAKAPPPPLPPAPLPNKAAPPMIAMSLGDTDIGKMERAAKGDDGDTDGKDSATPYGPGSGPGGARLYEAEWYREPPPNVLKLYLPNGAPPGAWATIACRTVANYHVDDCRQLDDSPPGMGLSRAVRQAAWQFLVRPPRLGGKPLIGAWVRIRFTFEKPPAS